MSDQRPKILLIDDDPQFVYLMQRYAGMSDCRLLSTREANEAITLVQQEQPALVIVDIMLPNMAGQKIVRALKSASATYHIPVALCSTLETPLYDWEEEADIRLLKPIMVDDFLNTLASVGIGTIRPPRMED